ncbi:nucleotide disphospho-sugar-binding domain-containing protein [Sphingomonas cavernae]|uniref:Erythromycin biosynthesis protein CIII-like C-terminal domain-containing protein n=1 Tax=Sphingomonas cavernae TaxID=2320861 RepID=A0A418WJS6_9SPHN|nr:nucleotide disphospho-sugar-binding domain-containing protein [Sphingomonas cavernae]RJF90212.1 hypothetical protein D3876_07960 [Sphingomonas cavernae]
MARILATWELGLGYGHVANIAPVASALAGRGHATFFAARDPLLAARYPDTPYSGIVQAPIFTQPVARTETITYAQVIAEAGYVDPRSALALVRAWLALFETIAPDALLIEHAPISLLAAHVAGIPAVRVGPSFTAPLAAHAATPLLPWVEHDAADIAFSAGVADGVVREVCRAFGARPLDGLSDLLRGAPAIALTWPELDHFGAHPGVRYHGPLAGLKATAQPEWPQGEGPRALVYVRFDRPAGRNLAAALGALGWPVIWHAAQAPQTPLAPNIHFTADPVDIVAVARQADLFVGRGGHGASCMALRAGIPQLHFPDTLESLLVTYRLQQAGVAQSQSGRADATTIRASLERLASGAGCRAAARRLGTQYAGYGPEIAAGDVAEEVLAALDFGSRRPARSRAQKPPKHYGNGA